MGARLSASALPRAVRCLYSFRSDVETLPDAPGTSAQIGTLVHKAIETSLLGGYAGPADTAGTMTPGQIRTARTLFDTWKVWWSVTGSFTFTIWQPEVKMALTQDGIIAFSGGAARDYGERSTSFLPGTADAVLVSGGVVHVRDWKTGRGPYEAKTDEQVRFLGAVAAKIHLVPEARIYIDQISPERVLTTSHVMDEAEIDATIADARALLRLVPDSIPAGGAWCKYCPAAKCSDRKAG